MLIGSINIRVGKKISVVYRNKKEWVVNNIDKNWILYT
jgi:hypothetical protein